MALIRSKMKEIRDQEIRDRERGDGVGVRAVKAETPRRNSRRS